MLCQLITRGITLPSNLSISGMTKLLFHLIINALKQGEQVHLQNFIYCLINITRRMSEKGKDNLCKDVATICKQASDHLWNAAIKLEQSNSMEKQKTAVMAFSLRSNSIDLLTVSKIDSSLIIERGLKAARQFQLSYSNISGSEDLQKFLFSILNNAVALIDARTTYNHVVEEGVCNHLDELCINCCKAAGNASHYIELLQLFSHLLKKDGKNVASQERLEVFKIVIQMLLCALCFHLKRAKTCENQKFNDDLKWNTLQKRITNLTEALRNLDSNLFSESQIIQAMDYLRFACNKFFNPKIEDTSSHNLDKIPQEMLSALVKLFSVCFNYQGQILKSKHVHPQLISNYSSWNSVVCPRLSILYLINSVVLKRSHDLVTKTHQNGR